MSLEDVPEFFLKELDSGAIDRCRQQARETISEIDYGGNQEEYHKILIEEFRRYMMRAVESQRGMVSGIPLTCE